MRTLILVLVLAGAASAEPITFEQRQTFGTNSSLPVTNLERFLVFRVFDYTPNGDTIVRPDEISLWHETRIEGILPSNEPRFFAVDMDSLPELPLIQFAWNREPVGYGLLYDLPWYGDDFHWSQRVASFDYAAAEIEITYYIQETFQGAVNWAWRVSGDGVLVPEPTTCLLMLCGCLVHGLRFRVRRRPRQMLALA